MRSQTQDPTKSEQIQIKIKCCNASRYHQCKAQASYAPASYKDCVFNVQREIKSESLTPQQRVP